MNKSEQINELTEALWTLQGEITDPVKNKDGHGYKYADLGQVLKILRPHLKANGLSFSQMLCTPISDDKIAIETILMHKSGQWISSVMEMQINEPIINQYGKTKTNKAQSVGTVITYAKRYALTAAFGISADEDTDADQSGANSNKKATSLQVETLLKVYNNDKTRIESLMKWAGIQNINDISSEQYFKAMESINKKIQQQAQGE